MEPSDFAVLTKKQMIVEYTKLLNESIMLYNEYDCLQKSNNELYLKYKLKLTLLYRLRKYLEEV